MKTTELKTMPALRLLFIAVNPSVINRVSREILLLVEDNKFNNFLDENNKFSVKEFKKIVISAIQTVIDVMWGKKCKELEQYVIKMSNNRIKYLFEYDEIMACAEARLHP